MFCAYINWSLQVIHLEYWPKKYRNARDEKKPFLNLRLQSKKIKQFKVLIISLLGPHSFYVTDQMKEFMLSVTLKKGR